MAGPEPRYGVETRLMPVRWARKRQARCGVEPTPAWPFVTLPGFAFACARNSGIVRRREILAHHEVAGRAGDEPDRLELAGIVLDVPVERRRGAVAAEAADGQRVAVGLGLGAARAAVCRRRRRGSR